MVDVVQKIKDKITGEIKEIKKKTPKMVDKEVEYEHNLLVERVGGDATNFQELLDKFLKKKESFALMVGEDCLFHPKAENIANLLALIEESSSIE